MTTKHYDVHGKYIKKISTTFAIYFLNVIFGMAALAIAVALWYGFWSMVEPFLPRQGNYYVLPYNLFLALFCLLGLIGTVISAILSILLHIDNDDKD